MKSTMIRYIPAGGLERQDIEALWDQGVVMEDWDYMLIVPADILQEAEDVDGETCWLPQDWYLGKLLIGVFRNRWYKACFHGKVVGVGVAYHA